MRMEDRQCIVLIHFCLVRDIVKQFYEGAWIVHAGDSNGSTYQYKMPGVLSIIEQIGNIQISKLLKGQRI